MYEAWTFVGFKILEPNPLQREASRRQVVSRLVLRRRRIGFKLGCFEPVELLENAKPNFDPSIPAPQT
jgi:hypothetical protein